MAEGGWTRIGGYSYTSLELAEVPQWVQDQMASLSLSGAASEGKYYELKGKNFRYRIVPQGHGAPIVDVYRRPRSTQPATPSQENTRRRRRATAVVVRHGKYLLVRDRGRSHYSLPGGGIERGEPALAAAAREIYEETGLTPVKAEFLFTHRGTVNEHQVIRVDVDGQGRVRLQRKEIDAYEWWDGRSNLPVNAHVRDILARLRERHAETGR
jgi:8-oxo-dGTP diphosphatase